MASIDEMRVELNRVRSKSSVWPEECVGKVMCCVSEKASKRLRKGAEEGQRGVSTWILKSPVMMSSDGDVARSSSKAANSEKKKGFGRRRGTVYGEQDEGQGFVV